MISRVKTAYKLARNEGMTEVLIRVLRKIQKTRAAYSHKTILKRKFVSLVDRRDAMAADWTSPRSKPSYGRSPKAPYVINWIMSPPSGGGGHQNIFRFIEYLDSKGHKNNIYIYSTVDFMSLDQARKNVRAYCKAKNLTFYRYKKNMVQADVLFATGWETAYPVFNDDSGACKMYFIQDFEPYFYPMGTDYVLAENTYRFGFYGITAGGWLTKKLSAEYGMRCDSYDFGADNSTYKLINQKQRKEVFFYARPVTARRGFELGIMALEIFHQKMPDYVINLAGWDVSDYDIKFPYVNHKALKIEELPELYNRCAAALVLSLTNMSLLPLELLACGTIPVVNDGPNNRLVSDNSYIEYTDASPAALAEALVRTVSRSGQAEYAKEAADSVGNAGWDTSLQKFEAILEREIKNG